MVDFIELSLDPWLSKCLLLVVYPDSGTKSLPYGVGANALFVHNPHRFLFQNNLFGSGQR